MHDVRALSLARCGVSDVTSVPVLHCPDARAVVVRGLAGWTLVFSGDTRPSQVQRLFLSFDSCMLLPTIVLLSLACSRQALEAAGRGATVLIHEATFACALASHAVAKRHCTIDEALDSGRQSLV
jgi:ribonuclease Z